MQAVKTHTRLATILGQWNWQPTAASCKMECATNLFLLYIAMFIDDLLKELVESIVKVNAPLPVRAVNKDLLVSCA